MKVHGRRMEPHVLLHKHDIMQLRPCNAATTMEERMCYGRPHPRLARNSRVSLRSGYGRNTVPKSPHAGGTIIKQDERPVVGVWIMPNNNDPGKIEDFVGLLRKPDDPLWPIAE